ARHGPGAAVCALPDQLGHLPLGRSDYHRAAPGPQRAGPRRVVRVRQLRQGDHHDARHAGESRLRGRVRSVTAVDRAAHLRRRQRIFLIFTAVLCLAYARQLFTSPTAGQDFRAFFAAATVSAHGGDPYDWTVLGRTEDALYNAPIHARPGDPRYNDFLPFPEGPWLALGLQPLTGLPWQVVYPLFAGLMLLAIAAGTWLVLLRLGWPPTRRWIAVAAAALSPIAFLNVFQGQ